MASHEYKAKDALNLLLARVASQSEPLSEKIIQAINFGKQRLKVEWAETRRRGPRKRLQYWTIEPYTDEEAVIVAFGVIRSHLLETRRMLNSVNDEFARAGEAPPKPMETQMASRPSREEDDYNQWLAKAEAIESQQKEELQNVGVRKRLLFESEPEYVREHEIEADIPLESTDKEDLAFLEMILQELEALLNFEVGQDGNLR